MRSAPWKLAKICYVNNSRLKCGASVAASAASRTPRCGAGIAKGDVARLASVAGENEGKAKGVIERVEEGDHAFTVGAAPPARSRVWPVHALGDVGVDVAERLRASCRGEACRRNEGTMIF